MHDNNTLSPINDWKGFYEELENETPRAAAIIAGAFIDGWLRQLIANFMVEDSRIVDELLGTDENGDRPLSTFASRIKAAYCLGLITRHEYDDLNLIRKIRNRFAHGMHGLSFDDEEIVSLCNSLHMPRILFYPPSSLPKSHVHMYFGGVTLLTQRLALRALEIEKQRRTTPA